MINIIRIEKGDSELQYLMKNHYSEPKGFVGRQLFYRIIYDDGSNFPILHGCIAFGSAVLHLPGRQISYPLENGLNNIFYHIEKIEDKYPLRNFTTKCLIAAEKKAINDYKAWYGDEVYWLESLVELPRTGELYKKAGYEYVGETKGFTCKREGGIGTDNWTGKRVWDTNNLRPKKVFIKMLNSPHGA